MTVTLNEEKCRTCHKFISNQTAVVLDGLCHTCWQKARAPSPLLGMEYPVL